MGIRQEAEGPRPAEIAPRGASPQTVVVNEPSGRTPGRRLRKVRWALRLRKKSRPGLHKTRSGRLAYLRVHRPIGFGHDVLTPGDRATCPESRRHGNIYMEKIINLSRLSSTLSAIVRPGRGFTRIVRDNPMLWPLGGAFCLVIVDVALWAGAAFIYRLDTTTPEGSIVYSILKVAHGGGLYRDYKVPPYATTPYPPLFYLASGALTALLGGGVDAAYVSGRLIAMASVAVCMTALGLLARRIGTAPSWIVATVIVAFTVGPLCPWWITCRPDLPAIALTLSGVYLLLARPGARGTTIAALLFLAGLYTKQTVVSAPVAMGLTLLWRRAWGQLAVLCAVMIIGGAALFGVTDLITQGRFAQNVIGSNVAPMMWDQPWLFFRSFYFKGAGIPLFFAALAMFGVGRDWSSQALPHWSPDAYPLALYALISLAVAVALSLKAGADANYFIEPGLAVSVFAGQGLRHMKVFMRRNTVAKIIGIACLLFTFDTVRQRFVDMWFSDRVNRATLNPETVLNGLKEIPGDILFSDSGFALRSGREILLLDSFNASYLSDKGLIDFRTLVARIRNKEIAAVVAERGPYSNIRGQLWWPKDIARAVFENYDFQYAVSDNAYVYLPKRPRAPASGRSAQASASGVLPGAAGLPLLGVPASDIKH
jgi:hypothetical protein